MSDVVTRRLKGMGYGNKNGSVQTRGEKKKKEEDIVDVSSDDEEEDETDSESESEEETMKISKQKKDIDSLLKFDISNPTHHYTYPIEIQFLVTPKDLLNSSSPIKYTIPKSDAQSLFLPDSRKHVDYSAKNSSHKNVAIDKAIPKTVSMTKFHNSSPHKIGIRVKDCEALNTIYYNSGFLKEKTGNKFLVIIEAGANGVLPNICLYDGTSMLQSNLAKTYGHINPAQLRKDDVRLQKGTKKGAIRSGSAYAQVLNSSRLVNRDEDGNPTYTTDGEWISLDEDTITKLIYMFEKKLHGQLVYWNLLEMGFEAFVLPPAESWTDLTNTQFSALNEAQRELFMKRIYSIDIGLIVVVAFPSLNPTAQESSGSLAYLDKKVKKQSQKQEKDF